MRALHLSLYLCLNRAFNKPEGIYIFEFYFVIWQFHICLITHRNICLKPHTSFFHISLRNSQISNNSLHFFQKFTTSSTSLKSGSVTSSMSGTLERLKSIKDLPSTC